jgi:glycosyltransferase involved in cell wall biosynthesis
MRLSIVTISLNQARFLGQAMRSVLEQGVQDVEYIVIDAGSTDGSVAIIEHWSDHLAFWCSESDGGPAAGLNKGFERATGDVLAYLNADDLYLPEAFRRVGSAFERYPKADVLYGHGHLVEANGKKLRTLFSDRWSTARYAAGACAIVQPATFIRAEAFWRAGGFNEANRISWDGELLVDLALSGSVFRRTHSQLAAFRLHPKSITGRGLQDGPLLRQEMDRIAEKVYARSPPNWLRRQHSLAVAEKRLLDPLVTARKMVSRVGAKKLLREGGQETASYGGPADGSDT